MPDKGHSDAGVQRLLTLPWAYRAWQRLIGADAVQSRFVREWVRPFPGARILDIGCGPAEVLRWMPDSIGKYTGMDMNAAYIHVARARWGHRAECEFVCHDMSVVPPWCSNEYDVVIVAAVFHHLTSSIAQATCRFATDSLRRGGVMVSLDPVYADGQGRFERWLMSQDRGKAIRTVDGYLDVAKAAFADPQGVLWPGCYRIPYTLFLMRGTKS